MDDDVASIIRQTLIAGKLQEKRDREAEAVAEQMERQMFKVGRCRLTLSNAC